ncbi:radical SAM family heme chaperone HemW [Sporolactobacillus sp. CQH2019]|nr:radical SAM family heme chaperone HemW [Sporolactobacillus sp. CQH2019]MDD9147604.1 radical SAM family heme chaperone HemW [Sporolactobacillus sp. CQH2019]
MQVARGAYIHIPFCDHICFYCDFNKVFIKNQPVDEYLLALDREMAYYASMGPAKTIYIGGGTPTALSDAQFERMLDSVSRHFMHPEIEEFTVEANPESLNHAKLRLMKKYGVTRLSIGIQSFDDRLLRTIGRAHGSEDAKEAVGQALNSGFHNVTLDLMFALPGQTETSLQESLEAAVALGTPHVSIYSLQIEPKTIFFNRMRSGKLRLPGEDIEADMYGRIIFELEKHGLHQYEISNFAKPGFEGVHNSLYWHNEEYYGIGAGAHGYIDGRRYANAGPIKRYIASVAERGYSEALSHEVTSREKMEEEMFLGLRLLKGVNKKQFREKTGRPIESIYSEPIERLKAQGLLKENGERVALTRRGVFLGNNVFEAFLLS